MYKWKLDFIDPFHVAYKIYHLETVILLVWIKFDFTENIDERDTEVPSSDISALEK
jgi:hypothetical protein